MTLTPIDNPSPASIPPLRAEIVLAPETVMAVAQELARLIIGFLQKLLQEASGIKGGCCGLVGSAGATQQGQHGHDSRETSDGHLKNP